MPVPDSPAPTSTRNVLRTRRGRSDAHRLQPGLRVCGFQPGRAVVTLMLARYHGDGDLGRYHEFGTCVMVNRPESSARGLKALSGRRVFIHHLPVDQSFTLEAGRTIRLPKDHGGLHRSRCEPVQLRGSAQGRLIAGVDFKRGVPVPRHERPADADDLRPRRRRHPRGVPWEMKNSHVRFHRAGRSSAWETIRTPRNWLPSACRSGRWCPVPSATWR